MANSTDRIYDFNKEVGGKALVYTSGSLGEMQISDVNLQHRYEYRNDMEAILELNGYTKYVKFGTQGQFCIEVYRRDDERSSTFEAAYTCSNTSGPHRPYQSDHKRGLTII